LGARSRLGTLSASSHRVEEAMRAGREDVRRRCIQTVDMICGSRVCKYLSFDVKLRALFPKIMSHTRYDNDTRDFHCGNRPRTSAGPRFIAIEIEPTCLAYMFCVFALEISIVFIQTEKTYMVTVLRGLKERMTVT